MKTQVALYAVLPVGQKTNTHRGLNKIFSRLMVENGDRCVLMFVIGVDTQ